MAEGSGDVEGERVVGAGGRATLCAFLTNSYSLLSILLDGVGLLHATFIYLTYDTYRRRDGTGRGSRMGAFTSTTEGVP